MELGQLIAAMSEDSAGRELLESDREPQQVLEELRSLDSAVGRAASAYLELVGWRLLDGFDIGGRYAIELPDALLRSIRATVDQGGWSRWTSANGSPRSAARSPRSIGASSTSSSKKLG